MDELFLKINGQQVYLWCAGDQDGDVLDLPSPGLDSDRLYS
ncbi:MAG: hypothetical protein ACE5JX_21165 [Acidobacteriota bacterium]